MNTVVWNYLRALQTQRNGTGLHIYIVGDSTLRQQKTFLCSLLTPDYLGAQWTEALEDGTAAWTDYETCYSAALNVRVTYQGDGCCTPAKVAWLAEQPNNRTTWHPSPNTSLVVYTQCGMHLLHMGAARAFTCLPQLHSYEEALANMSRAAQAAYPGALQVLMTTNCVCDTAYEGDYAKVLRELRADPAAALESCMRTNGWWAGPLNGPPLREACAHGYMDHNGTRRLRERLFKAASEEEARGRRAGLRLRVVDGWRLTEGQCWATPRGDGRHFPLLVPLQVMELLRLISAHLLPGAGPQPRRLRL